MENTEVINLPFNNLGDVLGFFFNVVMGFCIMGLVPLTPVVLVLLILWFVKKDTLTAQNRRTYKIFFKIYGALLGVWVVFFILRLLLINLMSS